ncbi:MAG TPA: ATP-binding protein [Gammaproteobacteria bacterium]|jgi:signal transduction histidine kinase
MRAEALPESIRQSPVIAGVIASPDGRLLEANDTFWRLLGAGSLESSHAKPSLRDYLLHPADWGMWEQTLGGNEAREMELHLVANDNRDVVLRGTVEHVRSQGAGSSYLRGLFVDGTEGHQFRSTLLKMAGTESAMKLAAGVSHDVNNLLTVLVGNLYLAAEAVRADAATHEKLKRARDAAKRGADLLRQLMAFARGADAESEVTIVSPQKVVASLSPLFIAVLGSRVKLETDVDQNAPAVRVNRAQLESVVTNLVVNARDALVGSGGTVSIKVSRVDLDGAAAPAQSLKPGRYVAIAVRDDGCGIPEKVLERVFEPFFSTKGSKGNGLGLPMVRWFAERAGGTVTLQSQPQQGTAVTLFLPALDKEKGDTAEMTMPLKALPGGDETILVLSLDADFRATIEQILSAVGYDVVPGELTEAALSLVGARGASALVLDSHALSEALVERINEVISARNESTGIIVVGDASFKWAIDPVRVTKPFSLGDLTRAVRSAVRGG